MVWLVDLTPASFFLFSPVEKTPRLNAAIHEYVGGENEAETQNLAFIEK